MKRKTRNILLSIVAAFIAILLFAGYWAHANGYYHALRGGIAQDGKRLDEAIAYFKIAYAKNPQAFMVAHDLATCYALKGDHESCFFWLRRALQSNYGTFAKNYAKTEPDFNSVRPTPEFQTLIYDAPPATNH